METARSGGEPGLEAAGVERLPPLSRRGRRCCGRLTCPGGHDLPALVRKHAAALGGHDALIYLADLQQAVLLPFAEATLDAGKSHWSRRWRR